MIYTLFFSRLRNLEPADAADYESRQEALARLAREKYPGFVDLKSYVSDDGERLTVVRFEDDASQRAWARDAEHLEAQRRGRSVYYESYRIVICEHLREREFPL